MVQAAYLLPIHGKLCSHDEPPPRPGAWPSGGLSLDAMTTAMWVRAICRYRSVSAILRLWSLVRVGSFQMNLRMYIATNRQTNYYRLPALSAISSGDGMVPYSSSYSLILLPSHICVLFSWRGSKTISHSMIRLITILFGSGGWVLRALFASVLSEYTSA